MIGPSEVLHFLRREGFTEVGDLTETNGQLAYGSSSGLHKPSVYIVLQLFAGQVEKVRYVGMASRGWAERFKQHNAGLKRANEGKAGDKHKENHDLRLSLLREGRKFFVFERGSDLCLAFGREVPAHYAEETALIELLNPEDNKLKVRSDGSTEDQVLEAVLPKSILN